MSQQINLLNPALIRQKDLLNATNIALVLGLVCMLMLLLGLPMVMNLVLVLRLASPLESYTPVGPLVWSS